MINNTRARNPEYKTVNILGIRGIPAAHGGFETFAGRLAPYLVDRGWNVNVYCQQEKDASSSGRPTRTYEDDWNGIHRIHIVTDAGGSKGSVQFDWKCVSDVLKRPGIDLVLGYNTAIFNLLQRLRGRKVLMNMDGVEWRRDKWSAPIKAWLYFNEFIGANIADVPIADHPEISKHLRRHGCTRSVVIPYGADQILDADPALIEPYGVESGKYLISIARAEPENSILEIVNAFSAKPRGVKLMVLGKFSEDNAYHRQVRAAAGSDVIFPGAIYEPHVVSALRYHALAYMHGHQVGGTNPSLVEALGAGNAVIAHDNRFNRWVAGDGQFYFNNVESLGGQMDLVTENEDALFRARRAASARHRSEFTWEKVLGEYETLLQRNLQVEAAKAQSARVKPTNA